MRQDDLQEKKGILRRRYTKKGGQISLVMVFVLIVALVFMALAMNWKTAANSKWKTINGATLAAAQMASSYASYAYMLAETQLEGKLKKKECSTNVLAIVAIIAVILAVICPFFGWIVAAILLAFVAIFAAIGAWSFDKSASGIVSGWNASQRSTGSPGGDIVEAGSVTALTMAVDDRETVYDLSDTDKNGKFCATMENCKAFVSRASSYTDRRAKSYKRPTVPHYAAFKDALAGLLDELGLSAYGDTTCAACNEHPEKCNPCCVASSHRPATCSTADTEECLSADETSYDPLYCAKQDPNNFTGFWGQTDLDPTTMKTTANSPSASLTADTANILRGADTEGEIFPFGWLIKDTKATAMNVGDLVSSNVRKDAPECVWCAEQTPGLGECQSPSGKEIFWGSFQQIRLDVCEGASCCVNRFASSEAGLPTDIRVIDRVKTAPDLTVPKVSYEIDVPEEPDITPEDTEDDDPDDDLEEGEVWGWGDLTPPGTGGAVGASTGAKEDFYIGTSFMLQETAAKLVPLLTSKDAAVFQINQWRESVLEVIARMNILADGMTKAADKMDTWLATNGLNQANTWCVPLNDTGIPTQERNAIVSGGAAWGSVQSVVNCLNYNANNQNAFEACLNDCAANCVNLPRSLVPGFDTTSTTPVCTAGSAYLDNIERSAFLAKDQAVKFQQRGLYLKRIVDGATNIRDLFRSKAVDLIVKKNALQAAFDQVNGEVKVAVRAMIADSAIVYGWMGPAPKGKTRGTWHVVGVEGRGIHEMPWIKAKKSRKGFKVCITFRLKEYDGDVGATVWRYDEDLASMDKFFKKALTGNQDIGLQLLKKCVDSGDLGVWCPAGIDATGNCSGGENKHWRPAFIGRGGSECRGVLGTVRSQSILTDKGAHYDMKDSPNDKADPIITFH